MSSSSSVQTSMAAWTGSGALARKWLFWAAAALTALVFALISLGGLVRNEGAGLACPDWPLCFGQVVPPMDYQVFLEWFHRLIAGTVSVFLLALSTVVFFIPQLRSKVWKFCAFALSLLAAQVVLGGMTVLGLLDPKWVSSHLAVGLAFFGTILWLTLRLGEGAEQKTRPLVSTRLRNFGVFTTTVLYAQILLGGLVSSNFAGLACAGFPTCNGEWLPPLEGLVGFQVVHRIGALVTTLLVLGFSFALWRAATSARTKFVSIALPLLVVTQVILGASSVLFGLPLLVSVAHLSTATALLGALLVSLYELKYA
ncbi:MAG: COX15/CtaA family protein [Bdellovibrionota bacterium]